MSGSAGERDRVQAGGILGRLARDRRGNTLAMMAIALIPLVGLAGSAIDTARVYYVKVRLQQACDAGALAGRKFMEGTDFTTAAQTQAHAFFDNNFQSGMMGSTVPTFVPLKTTENQVAATASTVVPMTLMRMAGFAPVTISVACEAKLEIPNLDIMFVLDTTGSMTETNPGDTADRITGLRNAVINFHSTLESAKKSGTLIRYGAVPYSSNVNVGMLLRPEWIADRWTYQSREQNGKTSTPWSSTDNNDFVYQYGTFKKTGGSTTTKVTYGNPESCTAPARTDKWPTTSDTGWVDAGKGDGSKTRTWEQTANGSYFKAEVVNNRCKITETAYTNYTQVRTDNYVRNPNKGNTSSGTTDTYNWIYQKVTYDVSALKGAGTRVSGGQITAQIGDKFTPLTVSWSSTNGCIEERQTVIQSTYATIPPEAYDLDVDMVPNASRPETQWGPWLPGLVFARKSLTNPNFNPVRTADNYSNLATANGGANSPCPSQARLLAPASQTEISNYVNTLRVGGSTHHDIGFLWGLRLMSLNGIFATENNAGLNGAKVSQHLIFMTDGQTDTSRAYYEAYGLSMLDQRRTNGMPTDDEQNTIVANRLSALCNVARRKNITVWVIAFGTTLSPMLEQCASGGRAFQANNTAQLNTAFSNIAAQIAKLRVSR